MSAATGITRNEAEAILGVHPQTFQRALDRGAIPTVDVGSRRLIVREGLEDAWNNRPRQRVRTGQVRPAVLPQGRQSPAPLAPSSPVSPRSAPPQRRAGLGGSPLQELDTWDLPPIPGPDEPPRLEEQKAWTEFTKRYREQIALLKETEQLVYKKDYDKAHNAVIQEIIRQMDLLPKLIQQRIPKISEEEREEIEDMIRAAFEVVSSQTFEDLAE